ncbi:MAG: site-specific integrase, partial [Bacteroidota bacterium]
EREQFKVSAGGLSRNKRTFALMLLHTGCRISEGLSVKVRHVDFSGRCVTFETLKRRKKGIFRQVPLPDEYLQALDDAFDLRALQKKNSKTRDEYLWGWSRKYGYETIREVMALAGLQGIHATPKGLRHGYVIACLDKGIPLNMVSKWVGHASIETTVIYANALGQEERNLAARLWG